MNFKWTNDLTFAIVKKQILCPGPLEELHITLDSFESASCVHMLHM